MREKFSTQTREAVTGGSLKKMTIYFVVGLMCLPVWSATEAQGDNAAGVISPCVALAGADSRVSEPSYHRVTSLKEWTEIWKKHKGLKQGEKYDLFYNLAGLPLVDFERYMVIAIFQGSRWNSAGLEAVSVSEQRNRIVFRFNDKSYQTAGPDGGGKQVTVYGFFVVPRSTKAVVLEEDVQNLIGKSPVWKERIAFPKL